MKLMDLVLRDPHPLPWAEGDNIPWNDPAFSMRMLEEHLSQEHDAASRRFEVIDRHVAWIHDGVLATTPSRVLDLGCGPGLYSHRLARLGHTCTGIDYSPASIAYAASKAKSEEHACEFIHEDIRLASYGTGYDLAMLIYGEPNIFAPGDLEAILRKAHAALVPGGRILLEPHLYALIRSMGETPTTWYSSKAGLFSDRPYLCLEDVYWDDASKTATRRMYIVDADSGKVTRHAQTFQAYADAEYQTLLEECGFRDVEFYPSLEGKGSASDGVLLALVARKPS